ncbi:MAG: glycosyltransferase family 39 protein [Candidatus Omnitrophica bacterium]|nr:glycosyltransferase family 39 protein [Candidatus Omnitrophota bacterium]
MESLRLVLSIFSALFIGWNILYIISLKNTRLSFLEKLFVSYGLGFGFISLEMFIFHFFSLKFSLFSIMVWWIPLIAAVLLVASKRRKSHRPGGKGAVTKKTPLSVLERFLICGISFEVIYAFFRALIKPIEAYDAIATYAIRSKIFYLAGSLPHDFFYNLSLLFPHPDYPLNIPLSETFVYLFLGGLNDQLAKVIFPIYFVAILGILYYAVKRLSGRAGALLFTFILATIPQFNHFATNAYHDVPFAYYCFTGTLFLLYWFKEPGSRGYLYISAVMTALAGWTKNEGFVYCVANIILLSVFLFLNRRTIKKRGLLNGFLYVGIMLLVLAPWLWVKFTANLVNSDVGSTSLEQLNIFKQSYKIWPIFYEFQRQIFGPKKWNLIWIIFILSAIVYRKKLFDESRRYATISLILIVSGYIFAYLIGRDDIWHMVGTTWSRMAMHFLPLAVYWLALLFGKFEPDI